MADFEPGELDECVGEGEIIRRVAIRIHSGDQTETDCLSTAHEKFNLYSSVETYTTLRELLRERLNHGSRKKRTGDTAGETDNREFPATATEPPAN